MQLVRERGFTLIARLSKFESYNNESIYVPRLRRTVFEFDAINAETDESLAEATLNDSGDPSNLAVVKILTTQSTFDRMSLGPPAAEGQWYIIELAPRGKGRGPLAWASSLGSAGYDAVVPFVVSEVQWYSGATTRPVRPLGADGATFRSVAQKVAELCEFPKDAIGKSGTATALLASLPNPHYVVVRDVGQASFATAMDKADKGLFHLDAGWPISYNRHTALSKPTLKEADLPVILSHWDWDHLHGYHAISGLAGGHWIAPIQQLGPGAMRVANKLASQGRLHGVGRRYLRGGPVEIGRCRGGPNTLNQTGLAASVTLACNSVILASGDAEYDFVPQIMRGNADYLIVAHHASAMAGAVVAPRRGKAPVARGVYSVGSGNGYGHPNSKTLDAHLAAGWDLCSTSDHCGHGRGDRYLGP